MKLERAKVVLSYPEVLLFLGAIPLSDVELWRKFIGWSLAIAEAVRLIEPTLPR